MVRQSCNVALKYIDVDVFYLGKSRLFCFRIFCSMDSDLSGGIGRAALVRLLLGLVRFRSPTVCRHFVAANILDEMERAGIPLDNDLVRAIVVDNSAGDEEAERILLAQASQFADVSS